MALANLNQQLASLRQTGFHWKERQLRISTKVIVDLAAFWALSDELACNIISNTDPEFCPYCYAKCSQRARLDIRRRGSLPLLLDCLPKNFIFCALHMRVRITERLIQMLAHSLKGIDTRKIEQLNALIVSLDIHHYKMTVKGKKTATDADPSCKVEQQGELRGHEIQLILQNFQKFAELEPDETKRTLTLTTWICWSKIQYYLLASEIQPAELLALKAHLTDFWNCYCRRYTATLVTPYIHILVAHLEEVLAEHKSVGRYSQEGFEATHKFHRRIFQRGSSHNGGLLRKPASLQILQRIYRAIDLRIQLNLPPQYASTFPKLQQFAKSRTRKDKKQYVIFNIRKIYIV